MGATLRLVLVWLALMGLLALTIGVSFVPLGPMQPVASYAIAAAKTGLVLWFFMEMRREPPLTRLFALTGFVWLVMLMTLLATDYSMRVD